MGWRNPDDVTEFEVHAISYLKLKDTYKNVRGEYHFKKDGKQAARFDIVILNDNKEIEVVIEVKAKHTNKSDYQQYKYGRLTGKPVLYIRGLKQAEDSVSMVRQVMAQMHLLELDNSLRK